MNKMQPASEARPSPLPDSFYRDLAASAPPLLSVYADNFGVLYANARFEQEFGISMTEMQEEGFSLMEMAAPPCRERFRQEMAQFAGCRRLDSFTVRFRTAGNKSQCFSIHVSPMKQEHTGRDCYTLLFLPEPPMDLCPPYISFDSKEILINRINDIGFGSFEWYIQSDKVYWSDSLYRIYDIEPGTETFSYEDVKKYTHPEDRGKAALLLNEIIYGTGRYELETRLVTPAGRIKVISTTGRLVRNENGEPYKLIGCVKDITAHRKIEEDLKKHVRELNESNKELEQFAYIASHDLQEPLRKVSAFGSMLAERSGEALDEEGRNYLERMIRSADNMKIMINSLLEYSRITQGTSGFGTLDLAFVLQEVTADLSLLVEETGAEIHCGPLPALEGDPVQLKQLFSNLVNNAIKFRSTAHKAMIRIDASLALPEEIARHHLDPAGVYYRIQVSDNGIGFEPDYASQIFKLFHRLHGKSAYPGSGLGLAICQRIVDNHNGSIYAESMPGNGAVFTVLLPQIQVLSPHEY